MCTNTFLKDSFNANIYHIDITQFNSTNGNKYVNSKGRRGTYLSPFCYAAFLFPGICNYTKNEINKKNWFKINLHSLIVFLIFGGHTKLNW